MSAFGKAFGGTFGVLFAILLACALGVGGCVAICGGLAALPSLVPVREPEPRANAGRAAEIEAAEAQRQIVNREIAIARERLKANPQDAQPAQDAPAEEPPEEHVVELDGSESILLSPAERIRRQAKADAEKAAAATPTGPDLERKAEAELNMAVELVRNDKKAAGRKRMQAVIEKYPDTRAAGEAARLLEKTR